jgi:bifunctional UDP-N-acetylglucosamine pyrophosphorylase/glucosamine-1-phosphate N-acetyltransferase
MKSLSVLILAAGKGSRMQSKLPKVLHEVGNAPLIYYPIKLAKNVGANQIVCVVAKNSHNIKNKIKTFSDNTQIVEQSKQLGTGHAVLCAEEIFSESNETILILYGDCPLISEKSIKKLLKLKNDGVDLAVLGFEAQNPDGYGRLILDSAGGLKKIVEARDATPEESNITFCNSGIMIAEKQTVYALLKNVSNKNAAGEFYLTDLVKTAHEENLVVRATSCPESEAQGINNRLDLAKAEENFQNSKRLEALENGVTLVAPNTVFFSFDTDLGIDTVVEPNVIFGPGVNINDNVKIRSFSYLEGCIVKSKVTIGPFARIRPETILDEGAKVGNFVEIKKSKLGKNAKASHLSYIGDASIGEDTNVGAGTIFCNYDGVLKHKIEVGKDSFIGSNTSLVAPLKIGDRAMIGAGSTVTDEVENDSLALGRARQVNKYRK